MSEKLATITTFDATTYAAIKSTIKSNNVAKEGYRVCITPHYTIYDTMSDEEKALYESKNETIMLDMVSSKSVNASSDITSYPMVSGDMVSDHMTRQPTSISISGTFSLLGSIASNYQGGGDRLTNIEQYFEDLKDNNVLLTISTMNISSNDNGVQSSSRFLVRENMVLKQIRWTETNPSVLGYSFDFEEAILVDADEVVIDYTDDDLPSTTLTETSFTEEYLGFSGTMYIVLSILETLGLIDNDFYQAWLSYYNYSFEFDLGGGSSSLVNDILLENSAYDVTTSTSCGSTYTTYSMDSLLWKISNLKGTGQIIVASSSGIVLARTFTLTSDEDINKAMFELFYDLCMEVYDLLSTLDSACQLLAISQNVQQEILVCIDSTYYSFVFIKYTSTYTGSDGTSIDYSYYKLTVYSLSGNLMGETTTTGAETSYETMKSTTALFTTDNGKYVYFINKNSAFSTDNSSEDARTTSFYEECGDLTNFGIFITSIKMEQFMETCTALVLTLGAGNSLSENIF